MSHDDQTTTTNGPETRDPHAWFGERIAAHLSGGLSGDEQARFEAHAAQCPACAASLAAAREHDMTMKNLFAGIGPSLGLEDRILGRLRMAIGGGGGGGWKFGAVGIHPMVRRAAMGVAAVLVVGAIGVVGKSAIEKGTLPSFAMADHNSPAAGGRAISATLRPLRRAATQAAPYEDALRYPASWPDVSEVRDVEVAASADSLRHRGEQPASQLARNASWGFQHALNHDGTVTVPDGGTLLLGGQTLEFDGDHVAAAGGDAKKAEFNDYFMEQTKAPQAEHEVSFGRHFPDGNSVLLGDGTTQSKDGPTVTHGTVTLNGGTASWDARIDPQLQVGKPAVSFGTALPATPPPANEQANAAIVTKLGVITGAGSTQAPADGGAPAGAPGGTATVYSYQDHTPAPKPAGQEYFKPPVVALHVQVENRESLERQKEVPSGFAKVTDFRADVRTGLPGSLGTATTPPSNEYGLPSLQAEEKGKVAAHLAEHAEPAPQARSAAAGGDEPQPATPPPATPPVETPPAQTPPAVVAPPVQVAAPAPVVPAVSQPPAAAAAQRKIIRNGDVQFEVDSFDSAFAQIGKIAAEENGYIASTDSEKLTNGKVKGTVTVRVPPDHLDVLVLKLRGLGDLKSQRIAAQDVTKQYTDFESQLRAARAMEERLLEIIKTGKGEVKDLVAAEKELGSWREKIEHVEGELRYYNSLITLSTLQVTMLERDVRGPTSAYESETVDAGIETEDVERARADALKSIADAKGRVVDSQMKKLDAGQLSATIEADLPPAAAGAFSDRLRQLGKVVRMDVQRKQTTVGGVGAPTVKVEQRDTRFRVSLYNLANIAPRETSNVSLACADVEAAYKTILAAAEVAEGDQRVGRVVSSSLNRQNNAPQGSITLEVRADRAAALEQTIRGAGEVLHLTVTENPDTNNVTRAKRGFVITLDALANVTPREQTTLVVASKDVPATFQRLTQIVQQLKNPARVRASQLNEQDRHNVTATLDVDVARVDAPAIEALLGGGREADVVQRTTARSADADNTIDSRVHLSITLENADVLVRQGTTLTVEVSDVERAADDLAATAAQDGGRTLDRRVTKDQKGQVVAELTLDVPLAAAPAMLDRLHGAGTVRSEVTRKDARVPESPLARAQFLVTLGNPQKYESPGEGLGASFRGGMETAKKGLLWTLTVLVIGLAWVGPILLLAWAGWRLYRRPKAVGK